MRREEAAVVDAEAVVAAETEEANAEGTETGTATGASLVEEVGITEEAAVAQEETQPFPLPSFTELTLETSGPSSMRPSGTNYSGTGEPTSPDYGGKPTVAQRVLRTVRSARCRSRSTR